MPARKKGSAKNAAKQPVTKNWEADLVRAQFEEDSWRACVSLVVGGSPDEEEVIQSLAVQKPQRKLLTLLTWHNTIEKIHQLGNPKVKKPDDVPIFYEVTEAAKVLLDAGEEIPCNLMAKVLKFQLLQIKAEDQHRREVEQFPESEPDMEKLRSASMLHMSGTNSQKASDQLKHSIQGKDPSAPVSSMEKKTKLKRRDDIDLPTFMENEPECGPQHYVLLVGFYQPQLIALLDALSVHVENVIKLRSELMHTFKKQQEQPSCEADEQSPKASPTLDAEADAQARRLNLFWSSLTQVLESGPPDSKLHDIVQLSYVVPVISLTHPLDPEGVLELGNHIFDGLAGLIYDCLEQRRQHQHYRNNLKLISVPTAGLELQSAEVVPALAVLPQTQHFKKKSVQEQEQADKVSTKTKLPPLSVDVDMFYYNKLLDLVPPEACSVPLMLDCMLEQVVISSEQSVCTLSHTAEELKPVSAPVLDHQLVSYMLETFLPLLHTAEERSHLLNNLLDTVETEDDKKRLIEMYGAMETQKKSEKPLVIRHHDERALRLRDITVAQGFSPAEVEQSMMRLSPVWELIQSVAKQRNTTSCWMSVKQQLQHYCTDDTLSWLDVQRLFHLSIFEAMTLTTLEQGVLLAASRPLGTLESAQQQTSTIIPWDNPLCYANQQLRTKGPTFLTEDPGDIQLSGKVHRQLDLSEMQSCRLRSLFEWHYTEHHDAAVFPQVLQFASEEYSCLDTFRGRHNNVLYIFCHNPMSSERRSKEFWDVKLHSDVKFRKYLEHVADTISNWTKEEELKRNAIQMRIQRPADSPEDAKAVHLREEVDDPEPVIRKGSLKAWKLEQEQQKEEDLAKKPKENLAKGKQQTEGAQPMDTKKSKALSGVKKSRPNTAHSSALAPPETTITEAPHPNENKDLQPMEDPFSGFIGYSLDGQLIHVSGCVQKLFPTDGGQITVEKISFLEGSTLIKLAVKKDGHHFYTHINQVVRNPARCDLKENCEDKDAGQHKVPKPLEPKTVKQCSFSAVLDNKIHISHSFYGSTGEYTVSSQEAKEENANTSTSEPVHLSSVPHSKGTDMESVASRAQVESIQNCEDQPAETSSTFNGLNASVPNGLLLQFLQEDKQGASPEQKDILVRQSFPLHGGGQLQQLQDISLSKERSRIITSQGAVIRCMRDGSTEVLFADGSVSFSKDSGPVWVCDSEVQEEKSNQEVEDKEKEKEAGTEKGCWWTTSPSGNRICTIGTTHKCIPTSSLLTSRSTDPITNQVMLSREDMVVSVQNPDGSQIVDHADGTRITSLLQDRPLDAAPQHLFNTSEKPESVTIKSTSRCASDCLCVTHCVDSLNENVHIQDACVNEDEIRRHSARNTCDKEGACRNLSERVCAQSNVDKNDEQSGCPEENVAENGRTSPCERKGSKSTKERVVLVEKEGCAMVVMYPERHTAHIFLADGTIITGNNQGEYEVFPSSKGLLLIQSDGKYMYSSDPLVTHSSKHCGLTNQPGIYTMSHTDKVACDITDDDGNNFQVMDDGEVSVLSFSPPSTQKPDEEELEEDNQFRLNVKHKEHCPRLFLVHDDGSGTELLSSHTVEEMLEQAYSDPTIALLMEPLPDKQEEFGITLLKPSHQSVWSQWLLGKQNPDITPLNLRNRSWQHFPSVEKKSPGPLFGTNIGVGLTLRERPGGSAAWHQPVRSCPKVLEMRELYQHRSFTTPLRNTVDSRLKEYIESLMEREQHLEEMKVKDPRTEEERSHARNLFSLILSHTEEDYANPIADTRITVDVGSLYSRGVGASAEQTYDSEDTNTETSDSLEILPCYTNEKASKWTERLAKHRLEISKEKTYREALRKKNIVPYFHPENIQLHQNLLHHHAADMGSQSRDHPLFPNAGSAEVHVEDAAQESTPRPLNPTPSQSESHAAGSDRVLEKRPTNPTPQTAGESSLRGSSRQCKSTQVDVTGKPRHSKVKLPTCILSSKPCSIPNQQFLTVEEPVRRKCRTVSLNNPSSVVRGFHLMPPSVDFGVLQEGTSSTITVTMRNMGVDTCRFRVKQPPPATGLRVLYNSGPVAAGLHVNLQVQLFAMHTAQAQVEPKYISQDITIYTETDILYLPVAAIILPEKLCNKEDTSAQRKRVSRSFQPSGLSMNISLHGPDQPSD